MQVAVIGAYGVGMTFVLARSPQPGETVPAESLTVGHGGKASNQAVGVARLGVGVALLTSVGRDEAAASARRMWALEGVRATAIESPEATMTGAIFVEPTGENRIVIAQGAAARLSVDDVEGFADQIAAADLCMVSLEIPLAVALRALEVARRVGTRTLLNPAPAPARPLSQDELSLIDLLTPNAGEACALAGSDAGDVTAALDALTSRFVGTVVATLGAQGACIAQHEQRTHVPAFTTRQVVDTTGAGDAFNAALAVSLVRGLPLDRAVLLANAAAAHSVGVPEVLPSLATPADLDRVLEDSGMSREGTPPMHGLSPTEGTRTHL